MAASVKTFVVSWNDAAEIQLSVLKADFCDSQEVEVELLPFDPLLLKFFHSQSQKHAFQLVHQKEIGYLPPRQLQPLRNI
jgi:hypothetical protein